MPHDKHDHDSPSTASATDVALLTARQAMRAAANAVDSLQSAERSTKPRHANRWRVDALGQLQDLRVLAQRAMAQLVESEVGVDASGSHRVELTVVLQELAGMVEREATLTGGEAINRASAHLIMKLGGGGR